MIVKSTLYTCLLLCTALAAVGQSRRENLKSCLSSDPDASIAGCTALIQAGKESTSSLAGVYNHRGNAYIRKGDYDRAIQDRDEEIRLNPNDAVAYGTRGGAYVLKGDKDRAIRDFSKAIRLDPNFASAYFGRGNVYLTKSDYDVAIQDFSEAIRLSPKFADAYGNRATTYCLKGDYDRAIQDFNEEIRLNPKDPISYENRAWAYTRDGDYDHAIHDFNDAIRLSPNWSQAYESRGETYLFQSNLPAATADFERVISSAPSSREAIYAVLLLHVATKRQGHDDDLQKFALVAAMADMSKWPGPLLKQAMGQMKSGEVMSVAASGSADLQAAISSADLQKQQVCEANYFIGEDALSHNQPAAALARFKAARDGCPKDSIGYIGALVELKRMGTPDAPPDR